MSTHHTHHIFSVYAVVCFLFMTVAFTPPNLNRRCTTLCVYTERALLRISSTQNLQQTKAICKARIHFSPATKGKQSTSWERTFRAWRYSMASKKCRNRRNTKHIWRTAQRRTFAIAVPGWCSQIVLGTTPQWNNIKYKWTFCCSTFSERRMSTNRNLRTG